MTGRISTDESNAFWRLKALAIFTIFFAHLPYNGEIVAINYLFNYLGIVGVPAFLMLSGFFEYTSRSSWKSRSAGLFIPLLIWDTPLQIMNVVLLFAAITFMICVLKKILEKLQMQSALHYLGYR